MLDNLCKELSLNGFPIDSLFEDKKHFGNVIIKSHLNCGMLSIVRDRGIWDCNILFHKEEIPLVAVIYLLKGVSFEFEELSFNSDESLVEWLVAQKNTLKLLSSKHILDAKGKWDTLTKERLKNMME
jgi:hypothetical protein